MAKNMHDITLCDLVPIGLCCSDSLAYYIFALIIISPPASGSNLQASLLRKMHPSIRLLHQCRITLFTRANCSLCTNAKQTLSTVWDKRPFDYKEIDVMQLEERKWKDLYEFDTPVVCSLKQRTRVPAN